MAARYRFATSSLLVGCLLAALASEARAQFVGGAPQAMQQLANGMNGLGGGQAGQVGSQLTPDQMQAAMWMRAMQGRGRRGVQTGVPQADPFGGSGFGNPSFGAGLDNGLMNPTEESTSSRRSTPQKRTELRKAREEQKQAAAKEAKAKKGQAAKDKNKKAVAKKPAAKKPGNG